MQQIYASPPTPPTPPTPPAPADPRGTADLLARLYAYPDRGAAPKRPWVRANMIASVDGAAETGGRSSGLGGPADRMLQQVLRGLADVVLVGAGTTRAEGYGPARPDAMLAGLRGGRPATPPIAVISASLSLDPGSRLLTEAPADARTIVLTGRSAPAGRRPAIAARAELIVAEADQLTAELAVTELARRGYSRLLVEGGPSLLAQVAGEGLLDELCLTVSPVLVGGQARRITSGGPAGGLPGVPGSLRLAHVLTDDGYLFCRYLRAV